MRARRGGQQSGMSSSTPSAAPEVLVALQPRPEAARAARRALVDGGLAEDIAHTVSLLTTEVVANAVRHGGLAADDRILLCARLEPDFARVEVADAGSGFDPGDVQSGFGLRLLDKLASDWGVDDGRGCRVWFEVDRRSRRFRRAGD
jgi:anti-sigma regulatory factor (Ser/Thr protein kinase)